MISSISMPKDSEVDKPRLNATGELSNTAWQKLFDKSGKLNSEGERVSRDIAEAIRYAVGGVLARNGLLNDHPKELLKDLDLEQTIKPPSPGKH